MDIARLRDVQSRERTTDSLQDLPESFYEDVAAYIAELKAERDRAAESADAPFDDPDVNRLTDEIQTAEQVAESLYERRVGKIVKQASFAAAGMGTADDGLTAEEQDLYEDLVARIEENKGRVLDVLAGDGDGPDPGAGDAERDGASGTEVDAASLTGETASPTDANRESPEPSAERTEPSGTNGSTPADSPTAPDPPEPDALAADGSTANGPADDPAADSQAGDEPGSGALDTERETVRITRDVGEIFGVDERTYTLESEDVVSLPEVNAGALVERDAATRLDNGN